MSKIRTINTITPTIGLSKAQLLRAASVIHDDWALCDGSGGKVAVVEVEGK